MSRADNDYWTFNAVSRKCLTVQNASSSNNAAVLQYTCNGGTNERWRYEEFQFGTDSSGNRIAEGTVIGGVLYLATSYFKIVNVNSGLCLTVKDTGTDNGDTLLQYDCASAGSNEWLQFAA
jgi:hypothetical protein